MFFITRSIIYLALVGFHLLSEALPIHNEYHSLKPYPFDVVIIDPIQPHTQTAIFLHGLGVSDKSWDRIKDKLCTEFPQTKFMFPNAPTRKVAALGNKEVPAWYDLETFKSNKQKEDSLTIIDDISKIHEIIDSEVKNGIPADKIIIGGFSQGSALALVSGIRYKEKLAGIVVLSGYLPLMNAIDEATNTDTPIFWGIGERDTERIIELSELSERRLVNSKFKIESRVYPELVHEYNNDEIDDVISFMKTNYK